MGATARYRCAVCSDQQTGPASEEGLEGGFMNTVVRRGGTVRRTAGPWTDTTQRLLRHVRSRGVTWVPEPLGMDEEGREIAGFIEGDVYAGAVPEWLWADEVMLDAVRRLRQYHDATVDFIASQGPGDPAFRWQLPGHEPLEVVCHNDWAPYNIVFLGRSIVGVIDWDTASPGSRTWDFAYLVYRFVPLACASHPGPIASPDAERARRLALACRAYGPEVEPGHTLDVVAARLDDLQAFTARLASTTGSVALAGNVELYEKDAAYVRANRGALLGDAPVD
jgi:hypothetical protein